MELTRPSQTGGEGGRAQLVLKSCDQGRQSPFKELKQVCSEWSPEKGGGERGPQARLHRSGGISIFVLRVLGTMRGFRQ